MKILPKLFAPLFAIFIATGCSSSELDADPTFHEKEIPDENFVSLDEALNNADRHFELIYGPGTRAPRSIKDVENFRNPLTRSSDIEEMYGFYIVNYDDDNGFALLSADRRREAVYALSNEGSLHLIDTIDNKGLSIYLNDLLPTMSYSSIWSPDTTLHGIKNPNDTLSPIAPGTSRMTTICEPRLTGFLSKFHQNNPFNKYCFTSSGEQAVVGCVPLAVGTLLAYHEWPNNISGTSFDWKTMKANRYHDSWPRLFRLLGEPQYLDAKYGIDGTGAKPSKIVPTLKSLGYSNAALTSFNSTELCRNLSDNRVILCGGDTTNTKVGHEWIIDGAKRLYEEYMESGEMKFAYTYYFHCVWGYEGQGNGFYLYQTGLGGSGLQEGDSGVSQGGIPLYKNLDMVINYVIQK